MKRSLVVLVCVALVASLSFAAVAVAQPAPKPVTMAIEAAESLLADAVAALQAQIDALAERLGVVESKVAALEAAGGGTGGSDDFWPEVTLSAKPVLYAESYGDPIQGAQMFIQLDVKVSTPDGYEQTQRLQLKGTTELMDVRVGEYRQLDSWFMMTWGGSGGYLNEQPIEKMVEAGTPIHIEYWVEFAGQRLHGTETITDWEWESWYY